jgi:hypothetical protein
VEEILDQAQLRVAPHEGSLELLAALSRRRKPGAKQHGWAERTLTGMTGG